MAEYQGWTLFDTVLILAKPTGYWDYENSKWVDTGDWQGYVVDPSNKKMIESARTWAMTYKSLYDESGKYSGRDEIPGTEFTYPNDGFTLELKETAQHSSQGGKLSFWNCWVTAPDGTRFKIGIAADLLLELLLQSTFVDGKCQVPLCFARRREGVGMLSKDMESYSQALKDMQKKSDVKNKKTSKHQFGHAYTALQSANVYAGDIWVWYEPIHKTGTTTYGYVRHDYEQLVGFRKLAEPKHLYWFPDLLHFSAGKTYKVSELGMGHWSVKNQKLPARIDSGFCLEEDITLEERIERAWRYEIDSDMKYYNRFIPAEYDPIGWSASKESYEMPQELRDAILGAGFIIED